MSGKPRVARQNNLKRHLPLAICCTWHFLFVCYSVAGRRATLGWVFILISDIVTAVRFLLPLSATIKINKIYRQNMELQKAIRVLENVCWATYKGKTSKALINMAENIIEKAGGKDKYMANLQFRIDAISKSVNKRIKQGKVYTNIGHTVQPPRQENHNIFSDLIRALNGVLENPESILIIIHVLNASYFRYTHSFSGPQEAYRFIDSFEDINVSSPASTWAMIIPTFAAPILVALTLVINVLFRLYVSFTSHESALQRREIEDYMNYALVTNHSARHFTIPAASFWALHWTFVDYSGSVAATRSIECILISILLCYYDHLIRQYHSIAPPRFVSQGQHINEFLSSASNRHDARIPTITPCLFPEHISRTTLKNRHFNNFCLFL